MGDLIRQRAIEEANERADRVVRILQDWADWNYWCKTMHLEYPSKSAVFVSGGSVGEDGEIDYSCADVARNEVVDTCIDALRPDQRSAIHHRYLCAVYRMRDYEQSLLNAHEALQREFVRKGAMW